MDVNIARSPISSKKWRATFVDKKTGEVLKSTDFGATGYRDYTLMSDKKTQHYEPSLQERLKVRSLYQARHKNDKLDDPSSAGALSYFVLWNKPTIEASVQDYARKFKSSGVKKVSVS
jgi:hypothetical protein